MIIIAVAIVGVAVTRHDSIAATATSGLITTFIQPSSAAQSDLPNSNITPGSVATTDTTAVCRPGRATEIRPKGALWTHLKEEAYARYGIKRGHRSYVDPDGHRHPAYEVDHLVPLELGGSPDDIRNLWPQPITVAKTKDKVEDELHKLVCSGQMPLAQAQAAIAKNWTTAVPIP